MSTTSWSNGPGDRYAIHEHDYDKVLVVTRGSITFSLPGDSLLLREGQRLQLPAGTPHGALVGPEGVSCDETHLPRGSIGGISRRETAAGPGT